MDHTSAPQGLAPVALLVFVAAACSGQSQPAVVPCSQSTPVTLADVMVFSDVETESRTGDLTGYEVSFTKAQNRWTGQIRQAGGELMPPTPLRDVVLDETSGSVTFWYAASLTQPGDKDSVLFSGSVGCRGLIGRWRESTRRGTGRLDSMPRIRP
jgi:hypothetical protein